MHLCPFYLVFLDFLIIPRTDSLWLLCLSPIERITDFLVCLPIHAQPLYTPLPLHKLRSTAPKTTLLIFQSVLVSFICQRCPSITQSCNNSTSFFLLHYPEISPVYFLRSVFFRLLLQKCHKILRIYTISAA